MSNNKYAVISLEKYNEAIAIIKEWDNEEGKLIATKILEELKKDFEPITDYLKITWDSAIIATKKEPDKFWQKFNVFLKQFGYE